MRENMGCSRMNGQRMCRVLLIASDRRDYLQFRHWLNEFAMLELHWCESIEQSLDYARTIDLVIWQDHLFLDDQESSFRLMVSHLACR